MKFLDFLKRRKAEVIERSPEQKANKKVVDTRHQRRIKSLKGRLDTLNGELFDVEEDLGLTEDKKAMKSDKLVQSMALINHEISVREKLLSWL